MHKHAALIKLWADGVKIQREQTDGTWKTEANPTWKEEHNYRVLPVRFIKDEWYAITLHDGEQLVGKANSNHIIEVYEAFITSDEVLKAELIVDLQF